MEENIKFEEQLKETMEKYKQVLAGTENLLQRSQNGGGGRLRGIWGSCKDLLEVADILVEAKRCVPKEEIRDETHLKKLYEGLTVT